MEGGFFSSFLLFWRRERGVRHFLFFHFHHTVDQKGTLLQEMSDWSWAEVGRRCRTKCLRIGFDGSETAADRTPGPSWARSQQPEIYVILPRTPGIGCAVIMEAFPGINRDIISSAQEVIWERKLGKRRNLEFPDVCVAAAAWSHTFRGGESSFVANLRNFRLIGCSGDQYKTDLCTLSKLSWEHWGPKLRILPLRALRRRLWTWTETK